VASAKERIVLKGVPKKGVFMSEFMILDAKAPATMEAVVEAVMRLSTFSESQILELVSAGKLGEVFPFRSKSGQEIPPDFVAEDDLVEASALPLNRGQRSSLVQSSMPPAAKPGQRRGVLGAARALVQKKFQRSSED
jgi:hypothetical protein